MNSSLKRPDTPEIDRSDDQPSADVVSLMAQADPSTVLDPHVPIAGENNPVAHSLSPPSDDWHGVWRGRIKNLGRIALDLIFPRNCLICDEPVEKESALRYLCQRCDARITIINEPCCATCGYPFFGLADEDRICPHCSELMPLFGNGKAAVLLTGPAREIVHELKYRNGLHLLKDIGAILRRSERIIRFIEGANLVPVPLHPRKLRERGFNQSLLLAQILAAAAPGANVLPLLRRVRDTVSQTRQDRRQRQENLRNAFAIDKRRPLNSDHRFIVVDDVFTTGSTLNACAAALRKAGARRIDVVTFGHG